MTRDERRYRAARKIEQRKRLARDFGLRQGTLYERHRAKINHSFGYVRKGHITHFVAVGFRRHDTSVHDQKQLLRLEDNY